MNFPDPEIPTWAEAAGVPPPAVGEDFRQYVERLGFDFHELTADLMPHRASTAILNIRLESKLIDSLPAQFRSHVDAWIAGVRAGYSYEQA